MLISEFSIVSQLSAAVVLQKKGVNVAPTAASAAQIAAECDERKGSVHRSIQGL